MLPYFVLDQINLGPIKLYAWGLFVGLGFSAGYLLFYYLAKREGFAPTKIAGLAMAIFVGAILGAKILAVAQLPGGFFNNINLLFSQHSGAMFMGGFVGAILFGWLYVRWTKWPSFAEASEGKNFWAIADLLVLPIALGIGVGRIGCALINDHQGAITTLPWGILWPDGVFRHPVGTYESLVGFGLFGIFWLLFFSPPQLRGRLRGGGVNLKNQHLTPALSSSEERGKEGQPFLLFLISYSLIRFFLDFTRVSSGPLADPRWGILSASQWMAIVIFTVSALFLWWGFRFEKK